MSAGGREGERVSERERERERRAGLTALTSTAPSLCDGAERAHVAPGYGLMATVCPGEVGVESSRETVHGNAREQGVSLTGVGWGRRCLGLFEDWQVDCKRKRQ